MKKMKKTNINSIDRKKMVFKRSKTSYKKEIFKTDSNASTCNSNFSNIYSYTDTNQRLFLDYTFKGNKNKLYNNYNSNNNIYLNKLKAQNYQYELEQTFELNLDILLKFYDNKNKKINNDNSKEILLLLNNIKKKQIMKKEAKLSIKQKCNELIKKNDCNNLFNKKINNQINQYNIKLENKINEIIKSDNYISEMKKRFSFVEKYINKIRFISEGKKGLDKKNRLKKFINSNNKNLYKRENYMNDIQKLRANISELKKDNKLIRSQKKLYKSDNPDINLIRVVEFYLRLIRNASSKNKILKNSINCLSKTLEILDLDQIVNFNEYKRNRQKSSYEIEFSDLENNNDENKIINNYHKSKTFMDFNKILK
jgi:hypothetical protein